MHYDAILPEVAKQSSEMERRADEAERETDKLKKTEYMQQHIGEVFEGVISSITSWGIYVELPNTIEGMIHVTDLRDDYYQYVESSYEMIGERTGRCFKLGQFLKVKCTAADKFMRTIDFELADEAVEPVAETGLADETERIRDGNELSADGEKEDEQGEF